MVRALVAALAILLGAVGLPAFGASPSPAPGSSGPSASGALSLTGHWAIAGTSGIDLVQRGSTLTGSSAMGISVSGTVSDRAVTFRWWRGASYAAAKRADRGTGTMAASSNGDELAIAAKDDEAGPGPFPAAFHAIRVHDIIATATPKPWSYSWTESDVHNIIWYTRAYLDYLATAWMLTVQTGYWPSPAVAWIQVENEYARDGKILVGGWLPNGGGPAWIPPSLRH